jgi:glutamine---fructose-6-phosphate transaminase (isomerizing)
MSELATAIAAQPAALARMLEVPLQPHLGRLSDARRVWLVGTGTSFNAADLGAQMLHLAGIPAIAVPAMRFACWTPPLREGDAVILITHTAETAFALRARQIAITAQLPTVSIVRIGVRWPDALHTVEKESSETYTVSYTSALMLLARLAASLGAEGFIRAVEYVPAYAEEALVDPAPERLQLAAHSLVISGAGPAAVTAREGALKLREGARVAAVGYDAEDVLHGHAVPLQARDQLLLIQAGEDPFGFGSALGDAAAEHGLNVSRLATKGGLPPLLAQVPLTILLQRLALRVALERGENPDRVIVGSWAATSLWRLGEPS